jgi:hypothetical protein
VEWCVFNVSGYSTSKGKANSRLAEQQSGSRKGMFHRNYTALTVSGRPHFADITILIFFLLGFAYSSVFRVDKTVFCIS